MVIGLQTFDSNLQQLEVHGYRVLQTIDNNLQQLEVLDGGMHPS